MNSIRSKRIINKPHLSVINYRIGTYSIFRQDMINSLKKQLAAVRGNNIYQVSFPISTETRNNDDYATALIEMWAYLLEILSYYNERIINESHISTATLRESLLFLCNLVDHRLDPGVSASAYIAIKAEKNKTGTFPSGFRIQTKPTGVGTTNPPLTPSNPLVFETDKSIVISENLNEIGLKVVWDSTYNTLERGTKSHVLQGNIPYNNLKPDDYILFVHTSDTSPEDRNIRSFFVRKLRSIRVDNGNTAIEWSEPLDKDYPLENTRIFLLRELFRPFGYNAPYPDSMPAGGFVQPGSLPGLKNGGKQTTAGGGGGDGDNSLDKNYLRLDREYDNIHAGDFVLVSNLDSIESGEVYQVTKVLREFAQNYGLSSNVTTLILDRNLPSPPSPSPSPSSSPSSSPSPSPSPSSAPTTEDLSFKIRDTQILGSLAGLELNSLRKASETLIGTNTIELDNSYTNLHQGQYLLIEDNDRSEILKIASVDTSGDDSTTIVTLTEPLNRAHDTSLTKVCFNIVPASHGETVRNEVIGSGHASIPFDTFKLSQTPITFVHSPQSETGSINSLSVIVNGVRWNEVPNLLESKSTDRHYITKIDEKEVMSVTFGDGKNGAVPPTGQDNIIAGYRKGIGTLGNVGAGTISSAVASSPLIKSLTNPLAAIGGTDRESIEQARVRGPKTMRVLERAVSLEDYENLALLFTGIAKCKASFSQDNNNSSYGQSTLGSITSSSSVTLTVAATNGGIPNISLKNNLRKYMDLRRDTNIELKIRSYNAVQINLSIDVQAEDDFLQSKVKEDVGRALIPDKKSASGGGEATNAYFSFETMDFGKSLYLSDVYSIVGKVEGVQSALVRNFTRNIAMDEVISTIRIGPTEIAVCNNDLTDPSSGIVQVNIRGGIIQ